MDLDELLNEAVKALPKADQRAKGKHDGSGLNAQQIVGELKSTYEEQTRFIRFAAWFTIEQCRCGSVQPARFDGLFEERQWLHRKGTDWRKITWMPLRELLSGAVRHTRTFDVPFCPDCVPELASWPIAEGDTHFVWGTPPRPTEMGD